MYRTQSMIYTEWADKRREGSRRFTPCLERKIWGGSDWRLQLYRTKSLVLDLDKGFQIQINGYLGQRDVQNSLEGLRSQLQRACMPTEWLRNSAIYTDKKICQGIHPRESRTMRARCSCLRGRLRIAETIAGGFTLRNR